MKITPISTFKKSVLSIVIISAVTGAFISWDKYQPRHETTSMVEFYQNREIHDEDTLFQSIVTSDSETLARLAEDNLVVDLEAEIEEEMLLNVKMFNEQDYSPEADEQYDYALENEQLAQRESIQHPVDTLSKSQHYTMIESPLLFAFDSSDINPDYYQALNDTAQYMQQADNNNEMVWQVVGYADLSGNYIYNNKLAKKRAQGVAAYLVSKGVNEEQLSIVSLGASNPINSERSIENNKSERRVEIHAYQAEITALVEQYNKQLKKPKVNAVKPEQDTVVKQRFEPALVDVESVNEGANSKTDTFEKVITESLTTAMDL